MTSLKWAAGILALAAIALVALAPDTAVGIAHHIDYTAAAVVPAMGLDALRAQHAGLLAHAKALTDSIAVGMDPTAIARIESDHQTIIADVRTIDDAIRNEEMRGKPWAIGFYASAAHSGLSLADLNDIVAKNDSHAAARDALTAAMANVHNANKPSVGGVRMSFDNPDFMDSAISAAVYAKMSGKPPEGPAREMMGLTLIEMQAKRLEHRGQRTFWGNRSAIVDTMMTVQPSMNAGGFHTTSDFPNLLVNSGRRYLMDSYTAAQSGLRALARIRNASDFRPLTGTRLSGAPSLELKPEGGQLTYGSRTESKESFGIKTFGRIFAISREALINDDLGAFSRALADYGRAAGAREADELVTLFIANSGDGADLDDGNPLYSTGRGNKAASGAAISVTTLDAGRQAMRGMKDIDGETIISVTPKHMVVSAAKETEAQQFLAELQAAQASNVNPFSGTLSLHVEPRFSGNAWRLFADPAELPTFAVAYLNGVQGPLLQAREGWTTLAIEFRGLLDFGCGLEDYRGTYLNPGN